MNANRPLLSSPLPATAVGLGAFLLFLVQPLAARSLLPHFGGAPSVWAVSLACYQTFLFLGYLLAHLMRRFGTLRSQGAALASLLVLGAVTLPLLPLRTSAAPDSVFAVALAVVLGVGPVFIALAAVGPLVQAWVGGEAGDRAYRLYAVSNTASLAALLIFPTVLERLVDTRVVGLVWGGLYVLEIALVAWIVVRMRRQAPLPVGEASAPSLVRIAGWTARAAAGVIVLNASTTVLAQDLSSMPMLWVAPLALYLVTWIVAFSGRPARGPVGPVLLSVAALGMLLPALGMGMSTGPIVRIILMLGAMTAACLAAHGALYASRPRPDQLTRFYLALAAGGAVGGLISGLAAPSLGPRWTELVLGYGAVALIAVIADSAAGLRKPANAGTALLLAVLVVLLTVQVADTPDGTVYEHRDFHGLIRVAELDAGDPDRHRLVLTHGATKHGAQFLAPGLRGEPTTYFARTTGCGIAVGAQRARSGPTLDVGVVGLGAGTIAAYGRPGDAITFYELSPAVVDVARGGSEPAFSYLADTPARVDVVVGDARVSLAGERGADGAGRGFDLLILDAFAGDAVPLHLLTREAFDLYTAHLAPEGMIAAHVSSNWIDLRPVLYAWARAAGWRALTVSNRASGRRDTDQISTWILLFRDLEGLRVLRDQCLPLMERGIIEVENMNDVEYGDFAPWTDERGGLLDALTTRIVARKGG